MWSGSGIATDRCLFTKESRLCIVVEHKSIALHCNVFGIWNFHCWKTSIYVSGYFGTLLCIGAGRALPRVTRADVIRVLNRGEDSLGWEAEEKATEGIFTFRTWNDSRIKEGSQKLRCASRIWVFLARIMIQMPQNPNAACGSLVFDANLVDELGEGSNVE